MSESTITPIHLTEKQARQLTDSIKLNLESLWVKVVKAWDGGAHRALGYDSWAAYCSAEFDSDYLSVPRSARPGVVGMLREHGMSTRAIAATVNASAMTVSRDLNEGVSNVTPEPADIKGTDGKTYKAPKPKPAVIEPTAVTGPPKPTVIKFTERELDEHDQQTSQSTFAFMFQLADSKADQLYKAMARVLHPDVNPAAAELFTSLTEAYNESKED